MTNSLTVALPTSAFLPKLGGAQVGLHNIAERLLALGHRPVLIVPVSSCLRLMRVGWELPYEVVPMPPKLGGLLSRTPGLGFLLMDRYLEALQRRFSFDCWHCTYGYPVGVALIHYALRAREGTSRTSSAARASTSRKLRRSGMAFGWTRAWTGW